MTVKTRSSANYSHHVPTMLPTTTTNHTVVTTKSSSSHDTTNVAATTATSVNADVIMASKNEAIQKFLRSYEAHLQKQFMIQARQWLTTFKYTSSEVDQIIASFNLSDVNEESNDDASKSEGCVVFSPVRKKQKSNDYTSTSVANHNNTSKSHKVLLPPKNTVSQQAQHPIAKKYGHVSHGLSVADLERIESLKKNDLISEIKSMDGEYHKSWTKPILIEALLRTHATFHQPATQLQSYSIASPEKSELEEGDDDVVMESTSSLENDAHLSNIEMVRTESAGNNITTKCPALKSEKVETSVQTLNHSHIADKDNCENKNTNSVDMEQVINQVPSNDSEEAAFYTARQECTQSQSQGVAPQSSYNANTLVLKKHDNGSNIETKASFIADKKQPQKSRVSPTNVPPGIVNSAKKSLLLSSQKKKETYLFSNVKQSPPVGRLLYNDSRWTGQVADQVEYQTMEVKNAITTVYDVESTSSNGTSIKNQWANRILSTSAYSSNVATLGMSQKMQASNEARHAQVARMKEKSKQTLPQKVIMMTSDKKVPGISQTTSILSNTERIRLHQPLQQSYNGIPMSTPSVTVPSHIHHITALQPALVDTVKSKPLYYQHASAITKAKSPIQMKQPEYTNYEMTDGEYDSDDDDDDVNEQNTKIIPDWARSKNLEKALEIQFSKDYPIDPDILFGEVETCNLEAIFSKRTSKYRNRNSSGDWTKDRVTSEEKRRYKLLIA